jgi:menaquinone-dependent protoporphyrinogen oxidase
MFINLRRQRAGKIMKTAIIYASKHGTAEKVARAIGEKMGGFSDVELFPVAAVSGVDIGGFDAVVVGTSIYAGQPSKEIVAFCAANQTVLMRKKLGLFVCGMHPNRAEQQKETAAAYPEMLREGALVVSFLGGEFRFESMNFFERLVARAIGKTKTSVSRIDWEGVDAFVQKLRAGV